MGYKERLGGSTAETFMGFISDLIEQYKLNQQEKWILIMDNARIHHARIIKSLIERGNLNILYLPPYSPMLNPIKFVFSQISKLLSKEIFSSNEEIIDKINKVSKEIGDNKVKSCINHSKAIY